MGVGDESELFESEDSMFGCVRDDSRAESPLSSEEDEIDASGGAAHQSCGGDFDLSEKEELIDFAEGNSAKDLIGFAHEESFALGMELDALFGDD